jgi:hypothetical protein
MNVMKLARSTRIPGAQPGRHRTCTWTGTVLGLDCTDVTVCAVVSRGWDVDVHSDLKF